MAIRCLVEAARTVYHLCRSDILFELRQAFISVSVRVTAAVVVQMAGALGTIATALVHTLFSIPAVGIKLSTQTCSVSTIVVVVGVVGDEVVGAIVVGGAVLFG